MNTLWPVIKIRTFPSRVCGEGIDPGLVANRRNKIYQVNYPYNPSSLLPTLNEITPWCVYLCRGGEKVVYVGMTCQLSKRIMHHRAAHTPLGVWLRASNPHGWLILGESLSQEQAEDLEARAIMALLRDGHPLLNRDLPIPGAAYPRVVSAYQRKGK